MPTTKSCQWQKSHWCCLLFYFYTKDDAKLVKLGICGEHGGDPSSVEFCHNIGLNYVSCSPFRVPIARLTAAQAALKAN